MTFAPRPIPQGALALAMILASCSKPPAPSEPIPSAPSAGATPETYDFGLRVIEASTVKTAASYDLAAARASTVPATVTFRQSGLKAANGPSPAQRVTLTGFLENSGTSPVTVTVLPMGPLGFYAEPAPASAHPKPVLPGTSPRPMPAPPPPLLVELPARTAVRVTTDVSLDDYDWVPGVPRAIDWSFLFWNEPKPRGTVRVP